MILHFFEREKHIHFLHTWLDIRGLDHSFTNSLPKLGFIGMNGTTGIVAAFLRHVEPDFAMFDSLITNPLVDPEVRHKALDEIYDHIFKLAKSMKVVKIIGFTKDANTNQRARKLGFKPLERNQLLVLDIA